MSGGIHYIEKSLSYLKAVPERHYDLLLSATGADLESRVFNFLKMRKQLLDGVLPEKVEWPEEIFIKYLSKALVDSGLIQFCKGEAELVDLILEMFLKFLNRSYKMIQKYRAELLQEHLEKHFGKDWNQIPTTLKKRSAKKIKKVQRKFISDPVIKRKAQAKACRNFYAEMMDFWKERIQIWRELAEVFDDLSSLIHLGWDLTQSFFHQSGWIEIKKLNQWMQSLDPLKNLIEVLGRWHGQDLEEVKYEISKVLEAMSIEGRWLEEIRTPLAPQETRGITRSGQIARMLPSEWVLLGHPKLKLLWHAHRAERALNTYLIDGFMELYAQKNREQRVEREREKPIAAKKRGPIIVCLDTSGSMAGLPEIVAKALTLEVLKVAHREKRPSYLISFSGPENISTLELSLQKKSLQSLLEFLSQSFYGGTDLIAPIRAAVELLKSDQAELWRAADLLLVTDGYFSISPQTQSDLKEAREEAGLQVHGVLIGNHPNPEAMKSICDHFHVFRDWEDLQKRKV